MSVFSQFVIMLYHERQTVVWRSMFLQPTDLLLRKKECKPCPYMLLLVAVCLDYWLRPYEPLLAPRDALLGYLVIWLPGSSKQLHVFAALLRMRPGVLVLF
jgi:hypothetical protein